MLGELYIVFNMMISKSSFLFPLVSLDYLGCPQQLHREKHDHDPEAPTYFFTYIQLVLNQIKLLSSS